MRTLRLTLTALLGLATLGCATAQQSLRELDALRNVDVRVDGTRQETLAGISIDELRRPSRLGARQAAVLAAAIHQRKLPLDLIVDLEASNANRSHQTARLLELDWRLVLDEREAVTGKLGAQPAIPPGDAILIPIRLGFDLIDFFGDDLEKLVRVARSFAGYDQGSERVDAYLMVTPTVETALGPLRYPDEIRVRLD